MDVSLDELRRLIDRYSNWGRYGPDDELGTINFITPESSCAACRPYRPVRSFLAIPFDADGPQTGGFGRRNPMHLMLRDGGDALWGATVRDFTVASIARSGGPMR